ncbi:MAG TPA: CocE/NonD family hydrolase [Candidatus Hydrogenedentes bacterium]|nr:CocE/NonD family hydrolase [Candidatus Hydrogenedentota bacterium]HOS01918.1 CocE/NonD family hydrolase [Candidatus Hydrogenedentota bacterium]
MRFRVVLALMLLAALAGCPSPYRLGFPGPHPVKKYYTRWSPDYPEISVFYSDAPSKLKHAPAVIFSTGWNQPRGSYEGYATQLAQWGYVAIIRSYPGLGIGRLGDANLVDHVKQISGIIDWLAQENERPDSPLYERVDADNVGVTGHSMGATVSIIAGTWDPRIRAVVSLDIKYQEPRLEPFARYQDAAGAYLLVATDEAGWCGIPPRASGRILDLLKPPAAQVTILGGDHMDFEDSIVGLNYFALIACTPGQMDSQLSRDLSTKYMIAWFNVYLQGKEEFSDYYSGQRAQEDVDQGLVTIELKLE